MTARIAIAGVCVAVCLSADAETLGRLFFTPEQRALFDRQRAEGWDATESAIRLDGVATRSSRPLAIWVNGHAAPAAASGPTGALRVGETLDAATRRTTDIVPDGSITRSSGR